MIKYITITYVLLSAIMFFRLAIFPERILQANELLAPIIMFIIIVVQEAYGKTKGIKKNFKLPILIIFFAVLLSMIAAKGYHNQSYYLTFWAQRFIYFYLFYFVLHILKPDIRVLERIIISLSIFYIALYLLQTALHPITLVDVKQTESRGTIRISIPGFSFLVLSLYISLYKIYKYNDYRFLAMVFMVFSIIILRGGRYMLAVISLVTLLSLVFSKRVKSKYLIYMAIVVMAIPIYYIFQDIFHELLMASERDQQRGLEENVRTRAIIYFTTDFFPTTFSYFMGNGMDHGASEYGVRILKYKVLQGFYQSDIGIFGEFSRFGIFFVIAALWMLFKALTSPMDGRYTYLKYSLFSTTLGLPFGFAFTNPNSIVVLSILFYIIDVTLHEKQNQTLDST